MIKIIENSIRCDNCGVLLSYEKKDVDIHWNWNHKFRCAYLKCPKCEEYIVIDRVED